MFGGLIRNITANKHFGEILKGSGIALILRVVAIIAGYLYTLLITRFFGAKAMGIFALCLTLLQISSVIGRFGLDMASVRFVAELAGQKLIVAIRDFYKKAMTIIVPLSLFVSALVFWGAAVIATEVFKKPHLEFYFRMASLGIAPFVLVFFHSESLRGLKRIKEYMLLQHAGIFSLSSLILAVFLLLEKNHMLFGKFKDIAPIYIFVMSLWILAFVSIIVWLKSYSSLKTNSDNLIKRNAVLSYKEILSVSFPMLLSSSLIFIMGWTDTIMLGIFSSERVVGIYNVALRISTGVALSLAAVNTIAAPKFAEFWGKKDLKSLENIARQLAKLVFWTAIPVFLILVLFPGQILALFGSEFKEGVAVLIILSFAQLVNICAGSVGIFLQMTGYQKFHQNVILFGAILNVVLNYLLIPKIGMEGAAIASAVSMIVWNVLFSLKVKKVLGSFVFYFPMIR